MARQWMVVVLAVCAVCGCSSEGGQPASNSSEVVVKGTAPLNPARWTVVATSVATPARLAPTEVRREVAADGSFELRLPRGDRYTIVFESPGERYVLGFPPRAGAWPTFVLNLSVEVTLVAPLFDLGMIEGRRFGFTPEFNPCELWLDIDGDGLLDYFDDDDDGDGLLDLVDRDGDGDGFDDLAQDSDFDDDGIPDAVDTVEHNVP